MSWWSGAEIFEFESFTSLLADLSFFMFFMNSPTGFKFDYNMRLIIHMQCFLGLVLQSSMCQVFVFPGELKSSKEPTNL